MPYTPSVPSDHLTDNSKCDCSMCGERGAWSQDARELRLRYDLEQCQLREQRQATCIEELKRLLWKESQENERQRTLLKE